MNEIPHLGFIVAAYAIAGVAVAATIAWITIDYRSLRAQLAELESRNGGDRR